MKTASMKKPRLIIKPGRSLVAAILVLILGTASGCMQVGRDAQALRDGALSSLRAGCDQQFELGVGFVSLTAARMALQAADLDPEVRLVLDAVRGLEVGIYRCAAKDPALRGATLMRNADAAMHPRGWERLITVLKNSELVLVYVPTQMSSSKDVKVCILTHKDGDLVLVSARSNLEPLLTLAARQANRAGMESKSM
jgi:hypothetical protein